MTREQELAGQGWEKRTIYDEPRLSELVDMYEEMGFEVLLEPVIPEEEPGCSECMKIVPERYKVLYTRKKNRLPSMGFDS